ncbi:MAG: aminomethyl-transferring glycine dehydrogenase subunit GcvPB, partial [Armatimonadaceae bacterium]
MSTEPTIFEKSRSGRVGVQMPSCDVPAVDLNTLLPGVALRDNLPLPELSEGDVMRHFLRISQKNYCVDKGFYPLGSCTMKYNPKINDVAVQMPGFARVHPFQPEETVQGTLQILFDMQNWLSAILGMDAVSLQPAAGAHGELLGLMLIRAYHVSRGDAHRNLVLVPTAAHGTNPASAARCGYKTVPINTDERGLTDIEDLKRQIAACGDNLAGMMLTNPNTVGLFEEDICQICDLVHAAGGQMYCDGANMNALVGTARPGDMGFDVMHVNLHKTFSVPHGGGGPGSGPVGLKAHLAPFMPVPVVVQDDEGVYRLNYDL